MQIRFQKIHNLGQPGFKNLEFPGKFGLRFNPTLI